MNMIEKVARAMHSAAGIMLPYDALNKITKEHLIIHAKAAIAAMREPSEVLMKVLENDGYDAMIDAALKEE